ncbi:hypothetical protein ACHAWF_003000 [Thalassiosira exigua]
MSSTATKTRTSSSSSTSADGGGRGKGGGGKGGGGRGGGGKGRGGNPKKNPKPKPKKKPPQQPQPRPAAAAATTTSATSSATTSDPNPQRLQQPPKRRPPEVATDPPLECPRSDFEALSGDAAGLASVDEARAELLDCARYGEVDACRAILDVWSARERDETGNDDDDDVDERDEARRPRRRIVDARDSSGSTPLHRACANGHLSTVELLLSRGAAHVANDSGNSPLHWAAARGHAKCVRALLDHYDALARTGSDEKDGNVDNGEGESERGRREKVEPLDVLAKNDFGRSALTEGFASGDAATVERLLNHDSAEEERLIGGLEKEEADAAELERDCKGADEEGTGNEEAIAGSGEARDAKKGGTEGVVHEFDFLRGCDDAEAAAAGDQGDEGSDEEGQKDRPTVSIRELPITRADDPFGDSPEEDTTGLGIWSASLVMARWMASPAMVERMRDATVLELGAGCGVPALAAARYGKPASVIVTDLNPETVENIRHNVALNRLSREEGDAEGGAGRATHGEADRGVRVEAASIDWTDASTYPPEPLDYVVCSDCVYQKSVVPLLKNVVSALLKPNGTFLYVAPATGRDGLPEFVEAMSADEFERVRAEAAPESYRANPLRSGDEEDCFLHFHQLASEEYVLYEFRRRR